MTKKKIYYSVLIILLIALAAAVFVYPRYFNLAIDFLNHWQSAIFGFRSQIPHLPEKPFKLGLDLQGGVHLIYEADLSKIEKSEHKFLMQGLRDVIERRVNFFGIQEPVIQVQEKEGEYRLLVELAGVKNPAEAIKMIGETPYLEFREKRDDEETKLILKKKEEIEKLKPEEISQVADWQLAMEDPYFKPTALTGRYLQKAELGSDPVTHLPNLVLLQFNEEGAKIFEELTEKNIGQPLAIYLDGVIISAPVVQEKIAGGKAQITGHFSIEEAKALVRNLNAGALPVPITLISQQTVGPILGAVSLNQSLLAGLVGFLVVVIFMIAFYRLPGIVASFSLLIYICFVLAIFKIFSVTLTLAGIGGFILSIGMAVDANVLIFSRLREELRSGKSLVLAIEDSFKRAWPSIRDGNLTTLLVALIFFGVGTSFVKGFALTLSLGIIISMLTAIIIVRIFLKCFIGTKFEKVNWLW
ncbi:MAG: protein translocase subunit SecD [Minisyncoccales bacterium]